jgi:hypothetical protein
MKLRVWRELPFSYLVRLWTSVKWWRSDASITQRPQPSTDVLIKCVPSSNNEQIQTILVNRTSLKLFAFGFVFWAE